MRHFIHLNRKMLWLLVMLFAAGGAWAQDAAPGADGVGDPYYPLLGNGGYDVQHYTLELDVDVESNTILAGIATIDALATQHLSRFNLDFSGLDVADITVNNAAATFTREGHELIITPTEVLPDGEMFTTTVDYSGIPEPVPGPNRIDLPVVGWIRFNTGIYVISEPDGAMTWYPNNNHPSDKATYTFRITAPKPYSVSANGILTDQIDNGDTQTFVWESGDPIASYLTSVAIDEFRVDVVEGPNGLPLYYFSPPESTDQVLDLYEPTAEAIAYFGELFGPYPFESYGIVTVRDRSFRSALEIQTRSTFGPSRLDEETIVHELLHQWWGDAISPAMWQDVWLNEGFATYGELLWLEHQGDRNGAILWLSNTIFFVENNDLNPPGAPGRHQLLAGAVYARGALTLHMLRRDVGDDAFFEILQTYFERFKNGNASTADFIAVSEEVAERDLMHIFDPWLYGKEPPPLP